MTEIDKMKSRVNNLRLDIDKVKYLDFNKDGKVDGRDLAWIIAVLVAIFFNLLLDYVQNSLTSGNWMPNGEIDFISYIGSAFILMFYTKKKFELMDATVREKDHAINLLKKEKQEMRIEHQSDIAKHQLELQQLKAGINSKKEFIELVWNFIPDEIKEKITKI